MREITAGFHRPKCKILPSLVLICGALVTACREFERIRIRRRSMWQSRGGGGEGTQAVGKASRRRQEQRRRGGAASGGAVKREARTDTRSLAEAALQRLVRLNPPGRISLAGAYALGYGALGVAQLEEEGPDWEPYAPSSPTWLDISPNNFGTTQKLKATHTNTPEPGPARNSPTGYVPRTHLRQAT